MAMKNPAIKQQKAIVHKANPVVLNQILVIRKNADSSRKIKSGGRSSVSPNRNLFRLNDFTPFVTSEKPNHEYLNHVFIQRARCLTSWPELEVFSSYTTAW